ncbi:MAG: DNA replication/repair protein RecF [Pseudidiomarina maritima]|uniref:DNA replication and repair protein RecF n=1 Tax=Pseudidiomarina fusca TaxID=2965078 RepID=A0ABU3KX31_9GAMM|nr:DNA replication/repair protein RecF [Pseudidiomarina sp. GXY010]MDT7525711.1 DNA replication/repair protein RecF [Pseudidiomarina sp. GXY010]MDX1526700.1 DNA replication/repair protein RecF [Pseudidiomarina maritima]
MYLDTLAISQFRNFESAKIKPGKTINIISGQNGSGKTSLLESIYCLGFGRSFRHGTYKQLIRNEQDQFVVFAKVVEQTGTLHQVGFQRTMQGDVQLKIDQQREKKFSALARMVPVQLMTPESVELILGGPKLRRQFIDWGVFHVEHSFYPDWINFSKVLKQRNSLLKMKRFEREREYWDKQFAHYGEQVHSFRHAYLEAFIPVLSERLKEFLPSYDFNFSLRSGWDKELSLADALVKHQEQDIRYGHSTVGPHKAEMRMTANGEDVKNILSRGQLKLLVAALKLVQGDYLHQRTGIQCIYLVDDITAELDTESQAKFCGALVASNSQVFVSAIDGSDIHDLLKSPDTKMFHVEHGTVKEQ